jgi:cytochrome c-type biogenesis protein CcmH/NrfG
LPGAVEDARRAAKARPGDAYYWRYLGQVERANGNLAAAAEAFRRTLKITPGDKNVAAQLEQLDAKFKAPVPESG